MNPLFAHYPLNEKGLEKVKIAKNALEVAHDAIEALVDHKASRELALVKTHLEMAGMYASKVVSQDSANWKTSSSKP